MALKFRNPENGDVVEITRMSCIATFFLGPLFLLANGFTWHALAWLGLAFGPAFVWSGDVLIVSIPATCLLYALLIRLLQVNQLRTAGWLPTRADAVPSTHQRGYAAPSPGPVDANATRMKACTYCKQPIRIEAVRCRHCLATLHPLQSANDG